MIAPWPCISRGTEWLVPMVPGLVSVMVVPAKSSTVRLPERAFFTISSYAAQNWAKSSVSQLLMLGTSSWRVPSGLGQVDGQAEVDVPRHDHGRLAVDDLVAVVHLRVGLQRLHHREADQVRVGHLAAAGPAQVVVDHHALVDQQLDRQRTDTGRGRHRQRDVHVLGGPGRCAAEHGPDRLLDVDVGPAGRVGRVGRHAAAVAGCAGPGVLGLDRPLDRRGPSAGRFRRRRLLLVGSASSAGRRRRRSGRRLGRGGAAALGSRRGRSPARAPSPFGRASAFAVARAGCGPSPGRSWLPSDSWAARSWVLK